MTQLEVIKSIKRVFTLENLLNIIDVEEGLEVGTQSNEWGVFIHLGDNAYFANYGGICKYVNEHMELTAKPTLSAKQLDKVITDYIQSRLAEIFMGDGSSGTSGLIDVSK